MSLPRFECTVPGCGRQFVRKEHLTRHAKSHGARPQHECPICGRRYARSDVLKRHIEFHPQQSRRAEAACVSCHQRKRKCDENTPCQACLSNGIDCIRPSTNRGPGSGADSSTRPATSAHQHDTDNGDMLGSAWSNERDHHQPPPYQWPLASPSPPDSNSSLVSPSQALAQWTLFADTPVSPSSQSANHPSQFQRPNVTPNEGSGVPTERDPLRDLDDTFRVTAGETITSPSPKTGGSPSNQALHHLLRQDLTNTRHLVQLFFAEIHPYWTILHAPTFKLQNASDLLLGAMVMFSSWVTGRDHHSGLASVVLDEVMAATGPDATPSLHTLQALLLCVVYAICRRSEPGMLARAVRLNAILVTTCRCLDIFHGRHILPERLEECAFTFWLAEEQLHRLAFSVLRVDTYLSVLLDYPPSVRYQEFCIPLPKSSQLWASASEEERRRLQWDEPAGRGKALFGYLMRDALVDSGTDAASGPSQLPYRLNRIDYHLGLCALQSGVWEAAREAHSAASDDIVTKLAPGAPIDVWRAHLRRWCTKMVEDGHTVPTNMDRDLTATNPTTTTATAAADLDSALTPSTLTLWHISVIKMHAPITLLRIHGSFVHGSQAMQSPAVAAALAAMQKPQARLRAWMASPCPRTAVWSAAQIARVVTSTTGTCSQDNASSSRSTPALVASRRLTLSNPLAVTGLLMSAVVVCSYASQTIVCLGCAPGTGSVAAGGVDLFTAGIDDPALVRWKETGEGWAVWGPSGIVVCRCLLGPLGEWFRRALAACGDGDALRELEVFLRGLEE